MNKLKKFLFLAVVINYNVTSKEGLDNVESIKDIQNHFIHRITLSPKFRIEQLIFISKIICEKIVEVNRSDEDEQSYKELLKTNINSILNLCGESEDLKQCAKEQYNKYLKLKEYIINHEDDLLERIKKIIEDNSTSEKKEYENSEKVNSEKVFQNNIKENTNIENTNNKNIVDHYLYNSTSEKKEYENIIKSFIKKIEIIVEKIMGLKEYFLKTLKENPNENLYLDEELKKDEFFKKEKPSIRKENSDLIEKV
jgi:hypothetical protein